VNLYRISQNHNRDYDTFDSAVVAAESEDAARVTDPGWRKEQGCEDMWGDYWCDSPEQVKVELLGVAKDGIEAGVILGSFNAG
jgi:hypothetical protein